MTGGIHNPAHWLSTEFEERLGLVLEAMIGTRPTIASTATVGSPDAEDGLVLEQRLRGEVGSIWIQLPHPAWRMLASTILAAAGLVDADEDTCKSTFVETIGQAAGALCQSISSSLLKEVTIEQSREGVTAPADVSWAKLEITLEDQKIPLQVGFSKELIAAAMRDELAVARTQGRPQANDNVPEGEARTLDLLFDVELPVSVSFGRAQLPLRDVIKLTTGSIIELNRAISEPVEIIVNNCVIARGDVVVVEGNFGVRIQQVISRQERLRTLS